MSVIESIFSTATSQSSATSMGQVPPEAREQAEDAIARVLAKNPGLPIIVVKGVDKIGQQRADQLMAKALKQVASTIKSSLDKDGPLLRKASAF